VQMSEPSTAPKYTAPEGLSPDEKAYYENFGRLPKPARIKNHKQNFDSADWSMKKSVNPSGDNPAPEGTGTPPQQPAQNTGQPAPKQNPALARLGGGGGAKKPMIQITGNKPAGK